MTDIDSVDFFTECPRTVDFVDELPRDPDGKLYKRLLRERYWTGHESHVI